jgi:hypothetical protein
MTEVQKHGFIFEDWVKLVLGVENLASEYTQKWDVPGEEPVSVKLMGMTNALEFGSALRIWEIKENFIIVIGRWEQIGNKKRIKSIDEIKITSAILKKMRGSITLEDIKLFDGEIKSFPAGKKGQKEGIEFAKKWKKDRADKIGLLTITHKIDSRNQRRIQCNLNYTNYVKLFGLPSNKNVFRKKVFVVEIDHGPRKFNH